MAESEEQTYQITFLPSKQVAVARRGMSILDAAMKGGIDLEHNCGGNCACATCHVIVLEGMDSLSEQDMDEEDQLEMADTPTENSRLGCQSKVYGNIVVEIPEE